MFFLLGNIWSFHDYIMVASRTACCTTGSVFLRFFFHVDLEISDKIFKFHITGQELVNILVVAGMEMFGSFAAMFFAFRAMFGRFTITCCTTGAVFLRIPCSLTLSMLTLTLMNWWSNRWKNSQYPTAGACLK